MNGPILVTGAAGFAGRHLVASLAGDGLGVVAWHRPGGTPPSAAVASAGAIEWRAVDLLHRDTVRREIAALRPAAVYHCGGAAHVAGSWHRITETLERNLLGTHFLFEGVRLAGLDARVLVPGSALIYRPSDTAIREDDAIGPTSPYALSKLAQEMRAAHAVRHDGCRAILARAFNHTGPGQDPSFAAPGFARQIARIEAGLDEPVLRVGNLEARRDLSDVRDVAGAYRRLMERGVPGRPYNVCGGRAYAVGEILEGLLALSPVRVTIARDPARLRPSDTPILLGDNTRIREEVGWTPEIPLERTLRDLLAYWRHTVATARSATA